MKSWLKYIQENMSLTNALMAFGLSDVPLSQEDLKKLYKKLVIANHPDRGGSTEKMTKINLAYEVLKKSVRSGSSSSKGKFDGDFGEVHSQTWKDEWNRRHLLYGGLLIDKINKALDQQIYITHFENIFEEPFTKSEPQDNLKATNQPHTLDYRIEYANKDRTIVFRLGLYIDIFKLSHPSSPIPLGLENLKIETNIHTNILYKNKDIKLVKKVWGNTKGLEELKQPDKVFPAKTINTRIKKHKDKPLKRKDVITKLTLQYKAKYISKDTWNVPLNDEYMIQVRRNTFLGMGTYDIFFLKKRGKYGHDNLNETFLIIYELPKMIDLLWTLIDKSKKLIPNVDAIHKLMKKLYKEHDELVKNDTTPSKR